MTDPRPPLDDQAARALAQDEFVRPVIVEAGAGTGKTALLVARVAAWCVGEGWQRRLPSERAQEAVARDVIEGVTAITFTEAAAAEMATRIGEALSGLARGLDPVGWAPGRVVQDLGPTEIAGRAALLCGEVHRLSVSTIHSFCQRVLAAHPFEAGLHPHFEIDADGRVIEGLVAEVVEEGLRELETSSLRDDWESLATREVGPAKIADALQSLVEAGARPVDLERDPFDEASGATMVRGLVADLDAFFDAEGGRLVAVPRNRTTEQARATLEAARRDLFGLGTAVSFAAMQASVEPIRGRTFDRLRQWSRPTFTKGESEALDGAAAAVTEASRQLVERIGSLLAVDLDGFAAARTVLGALLADVEARRTVRGIATFTDLLERTAFLLESHREVCHAERRRIDQLLVDEFQDTDDVQCRIVGRLALDGPEDKRPGLFVVGDPKQSIYAWRSADLAAYDTFVDRVLGGGGIRAPLTRNFRSVRPILDEVERVVEPVMRRETGIQPAFEALEATGPRVVSPGFEQLPWSAVEHWIAWPADDDGVPTRDRRGVRSTNELEARAIAVDIRRLHDEAGVRFGDVAVLLRATTAQGELLEAFRERGVPFEVAREREYFRQREIIEAAALVRAVLEPADVLALLTVVRSDAVGVPDVALAPLWDAGFPAAAAALDGVTDGAGARVARVVERAAAHCEAAPGSELVPHWPDALLGAVDGLAELRRSLREDPPDVFLERLRTLWLAEVSAGARHLGRFRQARLDGFYADLEQTLRRSAGSSAEVARFLRRAVKEGREAPTASEPDRDADAVHVMTIYGAKGLDFEHVYLAQIHKRTGAFGGAPAAVVRRFEGIAELQLFGWPTPGFDRAEARRENQARAERVRLLYVAMTRAKQRLVLSGGWSEPGETVDPAEASTLADLIAHRGDPEQIATIIGRGIDREAGPEPCVSWVIPALADQDEASAAGVAAVPARSADDADVEAEARLVAAARSAAGARMARSWTAAASDAAHRSLERTELELDSETAVRMPTKRGAAAAVGTAVHRLMETLELGGDLAAEVAGRRQTLADQMVVGLDPAEAAAAVDRLHELLDRIANGRCLERLSTVAPGVAARELAVLTAPESRDGTSVVSGAVDLIYTDPDDGRLVIADYKTDAVETPDEIGGRIERYAPQLEVYADAIEQALALDHPPHTELWFLSPDRIVRLS